MAVSAPTRSLTTVTRHEVRIDGAKPLKAEPNTGHNRWHPDIPPILRVEPGDEVVLETRDAVDGQLTQDSTSADAGNVNLNVVHPLTGPVYIEGAEPGDLLEVKILEIEPAAFGFTCQIPGFGFLRDSFTEPYLVRWRIADGFAESEDLPRIRIKGAPFPGTIGLAPSRSLLQVIAKREKELLDRGGNVLPPQPADAVPASAIASEALRTVPPRETAGNLDIKQLCAGTTLLMPVHTPGALFSVGDAHFAQGDGEVCGTAIEMQSTFHAQFFVRKGEAAQRRQNDVAYYRDTYVQAPEIAVPRRFYATTGMSIEKGGRNQSEDVTLAARNAMLNMIDHLTERGYTRQQAYAICSVAVDLKISEVVDVPNFVVSAVLPLDIFV
ncbi:MAG TPA: acetamidase/formamidase family protein [Candidatus Acidoferrum sp.]|nr:acetamidase/formamidase family protein [Candidatus Acidoferrum sp.]